MELHLVGKTVLVSAGSMGIGRAAAEEFIKEGCKVAICSSSEENLIKSVTEIKKSLGVEPVWSICDINKPIDIESTVKIVNNNFDILKCKVILFLFRHYFYINLLLPFAL